jgi:DNA-directed RNA polymerase specialized sigma24 family protein
MQFFLPFVFTQGCSMGRPERILSWWDQEVDRTGRPIRDDVRSAAHEVWKEACRRTQSLLADPAEAADVMEDSVAQLSRYLDRISAPSSSSKNGLLLLAFSRALRRLAAKSRRLEPAGGVVELSSRAVDYGWSRQLDARLDLENIVRKLSERNKVVLALRAASYTWEEVAQALGTSVATVRNGFWRQIREVRRKLQIDEKQRDRIDHHLSHEDLKPAQSDGA